jgi:hypothetical protein
VERQNQHPHHQDVGHPDEEHPKVLPDALRQGEVHRFLLRLGAVHPDEQGDPCPGLKRMGYCQDEPLGVECPCPGWKKMGCCRGEECQPAEFELLEQQALLVLLVLLVQESGLTLMPELRLQELPGSALALPLVSPRA